MVNEHYCSSGERWRWNTQLFKASINHLRTKEFMVLDCIINPLPKHFQTDYFAFGSLFMQTEQIWEIAESEDWMREDGKVCCSLSQSDMLWNPDQHSAPGMNLPHKHWQDLEI